MSLKTQVRRLLASRIADCGFRPQGGDRFDRSLNGALGSATFAYRGNGAGGILVSCLVGLAFPGAARLLYGEHTEDSRPALVMPVGYLTDSPRFREVEVREETEVQAVVEQLKTTLCVDGIRFLDFYADASHVIARLESEEPRSWFKLTAEQRVGLLAVLYHLQGDTGRATRLIHEALRDRAGALPKLTTPLREILERLNRSAAKLT